MDNSTIILAAIGLLSEWAKWLITLETAAIAIVGTLVKTLTSNPEPETKKKDEKDGKRFTKILATITILSFLLSIFAAALLLLALPGVVMIVRPGMDIAAADEAISNYVVFLNIPTMAVIESLGFVIGTVGFSALIVGAIWSKKKA